MNLPRSPRSWPRCRTTAEKGEGQSMEGRGEKQSQEGQDRMAVASSAAISS